MLIKGSLEDFIYIIFGIIWIAYSIYRGTQKSKQNSKSVKQSENEEVKKPKTAFKSFFEEILEDEEKPLPFDEQKVNVSPFKPRVFEEPAEKELFSYDESYKESNFEEETGVYNTNTDVEDKTGSQKSAKPTKNQRKPYIDLRKAVVYSEILNRRYF